MTLFHFTKRNNFEGLQDEYLGVDAGDRVRHEVETELDGQEPLRHHRHHHGDQGGEVIARLAQ